MAMKILYFVFFFTVFLWLFCDLNVEAANILGFLVSPSPSHLIIQSALIKGLLAKGHNITVVKTLKNFKMADASERYHEIVIDVPESDAKFMPSLPNVAAKGGQKPSPNMLWTMGSIMGFLTGRSDQILKHRDLQNFLKTDTHFDLVIVGWFLNDFHIGIGGHYRCPIVVISPTWPLKQIRNLVGNPASIASVPLFPDGTSLEPMTFYKRIINFYMYTHEWLLDLYYNTYFNIPYYNENFPASKGYPTFDEVRKNVSLVLTASHFSQGTIRPLFPNLVEIGGIQIKAKPDPLPADIQAALDNATDHGAIFLSFGSNMKTDLIDKQKFSAILKTFSKLKQIVLMKWDKTKITDEVPSNVLIKQWLPQDDILAHPNIRIFISHCGAGSVNEAKYHAVPILGIPMFADQPHNARAIVSEGWSVELSFHDLTEETFTETINEMLTNTKYKQMVQKLSSLYRDRPQTALETAVFWTEYVIRHDGAKHIQNPIVHLNFFQQNSLDVIGFLVIVVYIVVKLIAFTVRAGIRKCKWGKAKEKIN